MRGFFGSIARGMKAGEHKSTDISALTWTALLGGPNARSGVSVNIDSAFRCSTVLSITRVLAEGVAQLPLRINRIDGQSRKLASDHPVYQVLVRRPNDWMTSFELREQMMLHVVLTGNAYAYIGRGQNKIIELIPIIPSRVVAVQGADYGLTYRVSMLDGSMVTLGPESIFHIRGPSWNGYLGMDAVQLAREAIGLAIATEETHAGLHANGARPGGVLAFKDALSPQRVSEIKAMWNETMGTSRNAFRTAVLDNAAEWKPMAFNGVDAQHIETRKFQIEEICRAFRVWPLMVMHADKTATFASAEQFFIAHVVHSLGPWIERWEEAIQHQLLNDDPNLQAKFTVAALMRGDAAQRASFYQAALGGARGETAYMTRNEVRALEDLDPIEGGDTLPVPLAPAQVAPIGGPDVGIPAPSATPVPPGQ